MLIKNVIRDREPYSMNASATVMEAAEFMAGRKIGAGFVLDFTAVEWVPGCFISGDSPLADERK